MEVKRKISEYRSKLDKTLASPDLTNDETVHTLVKNQILQSLDSQLGEHDDYVVKKRSQEVSNFLSVLRSASVSEDRSKSGDESQSGWKVKQDTDELRVMYREGAEGTPFHSLLAEGYVDGPVDVCLCISCESELYSKWWPQIVIPTFRVISSQCVQKVRVGEQISLVRMKLSWPMSSREVLIHYFTFEYFQDGLVVVLLNSISDSENIDRSTHGFTRDGIPDAQDVVRMDLFGGFALQKVTENRSFFRTIATMDIKLDFVPPTIINFIARQLVGSGFKLYKKEVASVAKGDGKFQEALNGPLYTRIHEALYSQKGSMAVPASDDTRTTSIVLKEQSSEALGDDSAKENNEFDDRVIGSKANEIEEFEEKDSNGQMSLDEGTSTLHDSLRDEITEEVRTDKTEVVTSTDVEQGYETTDHFGYDIKTKAGISREVQQALVTLEKAIFVLRKYNNRLPKIQSDNVGEEMFFLESDEMRKKNDSSVKSSKLESAELTSHAPRNSSDNHGSRHKGSNSYLRETNPNKIAPASPDEDRSSPPHIKLIDLNSSVSYVNVSTAPENKTESPSRSADANRATKRKNKLKSRFCCMSLSSGKLKESSFD